MVSVLFLDPDGFASVYLDGEILFRTAESGYVYRPIALDGQIARRTCSYKYCWLYGFAAVSGSSAATLTTVGKMSIPELRKRKYPEPMIIGTLAGAATLGLMIPPSLTLIVMA